MVSLKSTEDIQHLAEGGALLGNILEELGSMVKPGVTGQELEVVARKRMQEHNVIPAFLGYGGGGHTPYPAALCVSVNEVVVHGIPSSQPFVEGDIVSIDAGLIYKNKYYLDSAHTFAVGTLAPQTQRLLDITKQSLDKGIAVARIGNTTGDIGHAVQSFVESNGLGVVHQLVGHGVGFDVHEEPQVPNFGKPGRGHILEEGLVIAIEPMVTIGDPAVITEADGWTISTKAGGLAAHFEHTVAITKDGPKVLT
ncbi:MAG: type I methionyl aminopeptidase [Candidatus Andersenbacteria bacterium]|nr:type I methionyl aminopeptidase [Candidatus Andersenbacteria bacterium]MBI3251061.1 type I methionyl aminopeptidase [Candidatus Andersenbacteria bacterium]